MDDDSCQNVGTRLTSKDHWIGQLTVFSPGGVVVSMGGQMHQLAHVTRTHLLKLVLRWWGDEQSNGLWKDGQHQMKLYLVTIWLIGLRWELAEWYVHQDGKKGGIDKHNLLFHFVLSSLQPCYMGFDALFPSSSHLVNWRCRVGFLLRFDSQLILYFLETTLGDFQRCFFLGFGLFHRRVDFLIKLIVKPMGVGRSVGVGLNDIWVICLSLLLILRSMDLSNCLVSVIMRGLNTGDVSIGSWWTGGPDGAIICLQWCWLIQRDDRAVWVSLSTIPAPFNEADDAAQDRRWGHSRNHNCQDKLDRNAFFSILNEHPCLNFHGAARRRFGARGGGWNCVGAGNWVKRS